MKITLNKLTNRISQLFQRTILKAYQNSKSYAQKSSTVSNFEMRRRLACQVLLLSFLKNQRDHLWRQNGNISQLMNLFLEGATGRSLLWLSIPPEFFFFPFFHYLFDQLAASFDTNNNSKTNIHSKRQIRQLEEAFCNTEYHTSVLKDSKYIAL